jgi:hemerythrin
MKNVLQFAQDVVNETNAKLGHSQRDWDVLREVRPRIGAWAQDFGRIYGETVFDGVGENDYFTSQDREQSFAVWYETLVSGSPTPSFWAETSLLGLDHAVVGVHHRQVIAMGTRMEHEFLKRAVATFEGTHAVEVFTAFSRLLGIALAVMVDSYYDALMSGMADIGMNERLVQRTRTVSIRKMIDRARQELPVLEWNESLSVGIPSIDDQHKKLVGMLNSLKDAGVAGSGNQVLGKILGGLAEYTVHHFGTEEAHMTEHRYPDLANHKKAHDVLVAQVSKFGTEFAAGRAKLSADLFKFLCTWLNGHIRGTDRLFGPYLSARGVS